ncbi:MAG: acetyl-CoA carboxylase biotin carboxylase subunit [Alphaproteobacteria bacterium]
MFKKILIANRGEIACRVIRTARRMGIATVAVYSEADADALHVREADEAVAIGPAPAIESYLDIARIVKAAEDSKADAVHPGYGFLSENPAFAEALQAAKIAFIGPPKAAIAAMGDKIASKRLAVAARVKTVPGHNEALTDPDAAVKFARRLGYPVIIKAAAGGGGKGMRIAESDAEVRDGLRSARNEAGAAFADDRVFLEKYIVEPRHIEIQILGDDHGNLIHLGERECSIQRRHQKVIEEAPSPFLDAKTRRAMGDQALAIGRAVGYRSAGTVEFIVDRKKNFYFLEMNTRLQVEHTVTELTTGIDLVEAMIRIAAGEKLAFRQQDIKLAGWAIEARIYAEDPSRKFLPSIGRLVRYLPPPADGKRVRIDSGVYEGGEISVYYDPMIAKLIAGGEDRDAAIANMRAALDAFYIRGLSHNIPFLAAVMAHPRFVEGRLSTGFIAEEFGESYNPPPPEPSEAAPFAAVAAVLKRREVERECRISGQLPGREAKPDAEFLVILGEAQHAVTIAPAEGGYDVTVAGEVQAVRGSWRIAEPIFTATINGRLTTVQVDRRGAGYRLSRGGHQLEARVLTPVAAKHLAVMPRKAATDLSRTLMSPMPGLLVSLAVAVGQEVKAGEALAVVEAMKMENVLRAERDGTVAKLHAEPGDSLAVDQAILEFA